MTSSSYKHIVNEQLNDIENKGDPIESNQTEKNEMNAYQLPFNTGTSAASFNYFPQNGHSYGIGQAHKANVSQQGTPFVPPPPNYFHPHQSHLQPFATTFTSPTVQSATSVNGTSIPSTTNPYTHSMSQYHGNVYAGTSSASSGSSNQGSSTSPSNNFEYSTQLGYQSSPLTSTGSYSYLPSCSSSSYSPYSTSNSSSAAVAAAAVAVASASNSSGGNTSLTYQSPSQMDSYLNFGIKTESEDVLATPLSVEPYSLNLQKQPETKIQPTKKGKQRQNGNGGRGRRRNTNSSPMPEIIIDRVFVWFIDDTVFFYLTLTEFGARQHFGSFNEVQTSSNNLSMFAIKFAEKYLFLDDLNDIEQTNIEDTLADDNGQDLSNYDFRSDGFKSSISCNMGSTRNSTELRQKMALRYRKINEIYNSFGGKLNELLDKGEHETLQSLLRRFEHHSKNWLHSAIKIFDSIKERPTAINILISSSPLIKTISRVMLCGLGPYFAANNIYSCAKTQSKENSLRQVISRFGNNCSYVVIGKSQEDNNISSKLELPFWPINEKEPFNSLLTAMQYYL